MQPPNLCIHFQRGFCSYGNKCRFLHQQVGAFNSGGGCFSAARWTQTQARGGHGSRQYSYSHDNYFEVSGSTWTTAPPRPPTRERSAPIDSEDTPQNRNAFNFRFMSWNILATELAHTHASELYPQAHPTVLAWPRRLAAVVSHVAAERPDVLCLQEVDDWPGLRKELSALGYDGVHLQRTGGRSDGCATLWLRDRLRLAGRTESSSAAVASAAEPRSESGIHRIRMVDHGLKDNVALLIHLVPRPGEGEGDSSQRNRARDSETGNEAATSVRGGGGFTGGSDEQECSSGSSMDEDRTEGGVQLPARPTAQRPKRTRQSLESGSEMTDISSEQKAAGTAPIASLGRYSHVTTAGVSGLKAAASAPSQLQAAESDPPGRDRAAGASSGCQDVSSPLGRPTVTGRSSSGLPCHLHSGIWVANTHVLFNTKRGDVKLGQLRVILSELTARVCAVERNGVQVEAEGGAQLQETVTGVPSIPVIFAGDFNCSPGSGLYRFLRDGAIRLAGENRREMSGQVEGYGYEQLQRDVMVGRPPQLVRWGPGPELRNLQEQPGAVAEGRRATGNRSHGSVSGESSGWAKDGRRVEQPNNHQHRQGWQQQQPCAPNGRSYSVRWEEEELVYAMGRVAVAQAIAAVKEASTSDLSSAGVGTSSGSGYSDSLYRSFQVPNGFMAGGHRGRAPWREQAPAAAAHWLAVTEAAVLRHPLRFRSAYAAMDEQEREPLFTTLHARYVGTVDFVWYTPGHADADDNGGGNGGEASNGDGSAAAVQRSSCGFRLTPLRVLHPPDPLSYPYGMPCAEWPSDHVSLVIDFRLS